MMPDPDRQPGEKYLQTLLVYYEEEISGEAYFYGLADHSSERDKMILLGRIERHAAMAVESLLDKYGLKPRDENTLAQEGMSYVELHQSYSWLQFMTYIVERYPLYLDEFNALEQMAPVEDRCALQRLTDHEVVVIDFAKQELAGNTNSLATLMRYLD
jgi:dimethylamine/trimethylamine dehydrogenase